MQGILKFGIGTIALVGLLVAGLFWPSEEKVQEDLFVPGPISGMLTSFGAPKLQVELRDVVTVIPVASSMAGIRNGEFRYRKDSIPWTFSVPLDWAKLPKDLETLHAIQSLAMADPFLVSYAETGHIEDFKQAVFFMLDWQTYYQTGRRVTAHAWNKEAALARVERIAYVLARIERDPELLNVDGTRALIRLADFHIQRMTDPEFGVSQDTILTTKPFLALCDTLDDLHTCPK